MGKKLLTIFLLLFIIFSLPSKYGIGDVGREAYEFIDILNENGIEYWEILPINEGGKYPYAPMSYYALNKNYISIDLLIEDNLIDEKNIKCKESSNKIIYDNYKDKWYNSGKSREYYEQFKSIIMFGLTEEELKNLEDSDDYMKKIKDDVIKLNADPNFYQTMTDEEDREMIENSIFISGKQEGIKQGIEQGTRQGIEQGTRQGIEENQKNIVRNMKEANYKVEDIAKITGLSVQEIEKI